MTTTVPAEVSFKEILVASDLSDASENAVRYAKAFARRFGSHLVFAHVSGPANPIAIPEGEWIDRNPSTQDEEQVEAAGIALRAEGFSVDAVNLRGSLKDELRDLAEMRRADLIVLGTHGRRGLSRFLTGSEAEGLLRRSNRPVLTVGPVAAAAPGEWVPKNIVCSTSLSPEEVKTVAYGYRLARSVGTNFTLLSVEDSDHPPADERTVRAFEDALAAELPEEETSRHRIRSLLSGRTPAANIVDIAKAIKSDLIVMGAKAATFGADHLPAGVLIQVLVNAPCPVLTIRAD